MRTFVVDVGLVFEKGISLLAFFFKRLSILL